MGTYKSTLASGSPTDFASITYHSTWAGIVDYDATPPTIQLTARATRLPQGRASLTVRLGSTTTGHATINLRVHPPKTARRLRLQVRATDIVGNESSAARVIALPPAR